MSVPAMTVWNNLIRRIAGWRYFAVKRWLPRSLFGRALLILVLPIILTQLVLAYVFFDRHWDNVTRHVSNTLGGEIGFFVQRLKKAPDEGAGDVVSDFILTTGIEVYFDSLHDLPQQDEADYPEFVERLHMIIREPMVVRRLDHKQLIQVQVKLQKQVLRMEMSIKRLESRTTDIYLIWMIGVSLTFVLIAVLFLRNQIRPIRRLAEAADSFGRGVDAPGFRPHGALEVKKAARAFIVMRERIKRQLRTRTDMLAGISHDLRTPLTRMKLELAMLPSDKKWAESVQELHDDVQQMEHMIEEYLNFARGEGREEAVRLSVRDLLEDIVNDYRRTGSKIQLHAHQDVLADIRMTAFRRMIHNIMDNGLRYGNRVHVGLDLHHSIYEVTIDDDGPGIPVEMRDDVFKPFSRIEPSRNEKTGGVGLGLSIARETVLAHGGRIHLDESPYGGLRVVIMLPLEQGGVQ